MPDKQQWELTSKFMENVLRQQLEQQLKTNTNSSWSSFFGFQRSSIEERNRQQCSKELERVLQARQQFDRTTKDNSVVCSTIRTNEEKNTLVLLSSVRHLIMMN